MNAKKFNYVLIVIILLLLFFCFKPNTTTDDISAQATAFENSIHKTERADAEKMEALYVNNQYVAINELLSVNGTFKDHRDYWFPLEQLKNYAAYIEHKADSLNYNKSGLGIRVYNAAKQNDDQIRSSVFMIGTYNKASAAKASFNLFNTTRVQNVKNDNIQNIDAFNYGSGGEPPIEFGLKP